MTLRPPLSAVQKGATLEVKFAAPDAVIDKLKSFTLAANVNGTPIPGEMYSKAGEHTYSKDVRRRLSARMRSRWNSLWISFCLRDRWINANLESW